MSGGESFALTYKSRLGRMVAFDVQKIAPGVFETIDYCRKRFLVQTCGLVYLLGSHAECVLAKKNYDATPLWRRGEFVAFDEPPLMGRVIA